MKLLQFFACFCASCFHSIFPSRPFSLFSLSVCLFVYSSIPCHQLQAYALCACTQNATIKFNWHFEMKISFKPIPFFFSSHLCIVIFVCSVSSLYLLGYLPFSLIVIFNWLRLIFVFNIFQLLLFGLGVLIRLEAFHKMVE